MPGELYWTEVVWSGVTVFRSNDEGKGRVVLQVMMVLVLPGKSRVCVWGWRVKGQGLTGREY